MGLRQFERALAEKASAAAFSNIFEICSTGNDTLMSGCIIIPHAGSIHHKVRNLRIGSKTTTAMQFTGKKSEVTSLHYHWR